VRRKARRISRRLVLGARARRWEHSGIVILNHPSSSFGMSPETPRLSGRRPHKSTEGSR
jgi:hypothetical protein